jgi:C-8 sterol isomerase
MQYVFDPDVVHECALAGLGKPKPQMFDAVADALAERYPGHIHRDMPWLYSIAGGAMIQMKLYFCSLFEYMMIWGTPIGSEGHSGRHAVGFWDTVLDGETWYYAEGVHEKKVFRPGDRIYVGPGQACGMNFTDGVWALEYERGPLPLSIPFGLADVMLSTLDPLTAAQTIAVYAALLGRHWQNPDAPGSSLLRPIKRLVGMVPESVGTPLTRLFQPKLWTNDIPKG